MGISPEQFEYACTVNKYTKLPIQFQQVNRTWGKIKRSCQLAFATFPEFVRANMGSERIRNIQENDDTEEPGATAAGIERDRTEVRPHSGVVDVRNGWFARRHIGHGRNNPVRCKPFLHASLRQSSNYSMLSLEEI